MHVGYGSTVRAFRAVLTSLVLPLTLLTPASSTYAQSISSTSTGPQCTYDSQGRLVKVLEPDENSQPTIETDYTYDNHGNLTATTQLGAPGDTPRVRTFIYDQHSHLLSVTNPEGGTVSYTYNQQGRLGSRSDTRGTTNYIWDTQGRFTGKQYSNGAPSVVYVYAGDGSHKVSSSYIDAPEGHKAELSYHYDAQGRLDQITQSSTRDRSPYTISLVYDGQGRPNQITYPMTYFNCRLQIGLRHLLACLST
jgi:YD repeat-containing protein